MPSLYVLKDWQPPFGTACSRAAWDGTPILEHQAPTPAETSLSISTWHDGSLEVPGNFARWILCSKFSPYDQSHFASIPLNSENKQQTHFTRHHIHLDWTTINLLYNYSLQTQPWNRMVTPIITQPQILPSRSYKAKQSHMWSFCLAISAPAFAETIPFTNLRPLLAAVTHRTQRDKMIHQQPLLLQENSIHGPGATM